MTSKMHSSGFLGAHVGRTWPKPEPAPAVPAQVVEAKTEEKEPR